MPQKQFSEDLNEKIPTVPQQNLTTEDIQQIGLSTKVGIYNYCLTSVIVEISCEEYKWFTCTFFVKIRGPSDKMGTW